MAKNSGVLSAEPATACSTEPAGEGLGSGPCRRLDDRKPPPGHFKRPQEHPFTRAERAYVTCLFGGLTHRHDELLLAAVEGLGYKAARIATPTKADCQTGREYCNAGMCNPAYFTIGALVNYLKNLRDVEGIPTDQILANHVFVTAGSCGPCRFGMYEEEYRLALRNSGFAGFRVLLFQQTGGLLQSGKDSGLDLNATFAVLLLTCLMMGDLLNDVAYHIRPYETEPGQTDRVFDDVLRRACDGIRNWNKKTFRAGLTARFLARHVPGVGPVDIQRALTQLLGDYFLEMLADLAHRIDREISVDYTRPKPVCKVVGEAWAKMTEGDGNFNMFAFLELQGAEVLIEPLMTWVNYLVNNAERIELEQKGVLGMQGSPGAPLLQRVRGRLRREAACHKRLFLIRLARKVLNREYDRMQLALGGTTHRQVDQWELRRLAHPFFNTKITGGEGHLEVGKTIYYSIHGLTTMVLSLKPFGCMPSTQSDGAQAAVLAKYPDIIFIPVETSADGDINAYSRVQMALGDAKVKCKQEFGDCLERTGYPIDLIRRYCREHDELRRPLQRIPREAGVVSRAANFILYVATLMDADPEWARLKTARGRQVVVEQEG